MLVLLRNVLRKLFGWKPVPTLVVGNAKPREGMILNWLLPPVQCRCSLDLFAFHITGTITTNGQEEFVGKITTKISPSVNPETASANPNIVVSTHEQNVCHYQSYLL
jgi:hypothetical protein